MIAAFDGMRPIYRSSIPKHATERVLARHPGGTPQKSEYLVAGEVVGYRYFFPTGEPEYEMPLRDGRQHGTHYTWLGPGVLGFAEPWRNGLGHGTAKQWDATGRLIGTYTLRRRTGWDLWRQPAFDGGGPYLAEAIHYLDGKPHGFEWWLDENQQTVYIEQHWRNGTWHGVRRQWNDRGRLSRGYPQYYVGGTKVDKRRYLRAARTDDTLPPYRPADDNPRRSFSPEVAEHLRR